MNGGNSCYFKDSDPDERLAKGASETQMLKANPPKDPLELVIGWIAIIDRLVAGNTTPIHGGEPRFYASPTIWADRYEAFRIYGAAIHSFQKINSYTGENL